MKKRIKHYSPSKESENFSIDKEHVKDDFYLKLLINDLKKNPCEMPKYSLWTEMVRKFMIIEKKL
jgi:hypothetical protein